MPRVRGVGIQDGSVLIVEVLPVALSVVEVAPVVEAMPVVEAVLVLNLLGPSIDAGAQLTDSKMSMKVSSRIR